MIRISDSQDLWNWRLRNLRTKMLNQISICYIARRMFGVKWKDNLWLNTQKADWFASTGEYLTHLWPPINIKTFGLSYKQDQRFRLMVFKQPLPDAIWICWVGCNQVSYMRQIVCFCASITHAPLDHLATGDIKLAINVWVPWRIYSNSGVAVPDALVGLAWFPELEFLSFINRDGPFSLLDALDGAQIAVTDVLGFSSSNCGSAQPVLRLVVSNLPPASSNMTGRIVATMPCLLISSANSGGSNGW